MPQINPSFWLQDAAPGISGGPLSWWVKTNGDAFVRDTTDTVWNSIGNINLATLGLLSRSGGIMEGAITGSHGLAPIDSPNFTTAAKLGGVDLVTMNDLEEAVKALNQFVAQQISSVKNSIQPSAVRTSMAWGQGVVGDNGVVPLPIFASDGSTAASSDVILTFVSINQQDQNDDGHVDGSHRQHCTVDLTTRIVRIWTEGLSGRALTVGGNANYFILAAK